MMCKNLHIMSNSAKCSAGRPLLPAYNFSTTKPLLLTLTCIIWGPWPP